MIPRIVSAHYPECPYPEGGECWCYEIEAEQRAEEIEDRWWRARAEAYES